MEASSTMISLRTIAEFLFFRREAILQVAASASARWLGLVFVISAGFAREYDGEYLIAEPWHLVLPLAASIVGCLALTLLVQIVAWCRSVRNVSPFAVFLAILSVYWMTAPMAWLYAIPFERFLSPGSATQANLVLLGVVSVWRFSLMIRSISVLFGATMLASIFPVMVFCLAMGFAALWFIPTPIFVVMGGIRLTESEKLILGLKLWLIVVGVCAAPVGIIGYLVVCACKSPWTWNLVQEPNQKHRASLGAICVAILSIVVWVPFLPSTQSEQRLRWQAEKLLQAGSYNELSELTHQHEEHDFPPHWDPPPRIAYGEKKPELVSTCIAIQNANCAEWFWKRYLEKLENNGWSLGGYVQKTQLDEKSLLDLVALIRAHRDASSVAKRVLSTAEYMLKDESLSEERRKQLESLKEQLHSI
jgi:hypothetical protein